jgi:hypothetical protein
MAHSRIGISAHLRKDHMGNLLELSYEKASLTLLRSGWFLPIGLKKTTDELVREPRKAAAAKLFELKRMAISL